MVEQINLFVCLRVNVNFPIQTALVILTHCKPITATDWVLNIAMKTETNRSKWMMKIIRQSVVVNGIFLDCRLFSAIGFVSSGHQFSMTLRNTSNTSVWAHTSTKQNSQRTFITRLKRHPWRMSMLHFRHACAATLWGSNALHFSFWFDRLLFGLQQWVMLMH